jgi:hypothetical protein
LDLKSKFQPFSTKFKKEKEVDGQLNNENTQLDQGNQGKRRNISAIGFYELVFLS